MSILSQKYKDYQFIQGTSEQGTSDDLISRQAVLDGIEELKGSPWFNDNTNGARIIRREALNIVENLCIRDLPSVTPPVNPQEPCDDATLKDIFCMGCEYKEQEPKTGHWIEKDGYDGDVYYDCSECGESWTTIDGTPWDNGMNYCPNCGCRMVEP